MEFLSTFDYIPWLLAVAWSVVIYFILDAIASFLRNRKQNAVLYDFSGGAELEAEVKIGAGIYQIRSAFQSVSIDVTGRETVAVILSSCLLGALFSAGLALFTPVILALPVGLGAGYLLIQNFIRSRWSKLRIEIEKEIPTFMRNLSGILQTDISPVVSIEKASQALVPEQPLKAWLDYFLDEMQSYGTPSLTRLQLEANDISTSLGLLVFEIGRMAQTGGSGYAKAFQDAADNLSRILEVRAEAHTESKSALGLAKIIIGVAIVIDGFLVMNPAGGHLFTTPAIKIAMALSVLWGIVGWVVIRRVVEEAVQ
ncbi:MAG: hypothetical protein U9O54_01235 [Chloroflexota bacterium]|nr:hypothetical protein [Chloroflexota bacterium]